MNTLLRNCRRIIPLSLLLFCVSNGFCQTSSVKGMIRPYFHLSPEEAGMIIYKLGCNFGIADVVEVGAYLGTAGYKNNGADMVPRDDFLYGINVKYHLTNLYAKNEFPMLELFLSGDIGGWTINIHDGYIPSEYYKNGTNLDYGVYAGIAFYPIKNLGIMGEVGYGKNSIIRAGVISRFQISK